MFEIQPVLLLAGFKKALAAGGKIEIECLKDAEKSGNLWTGEWSLHTVIRNGLSEQRIALGVSRTQEPRVLKTVSGVMSLGQDLGVDFITIPMRAGTSAEWTRNGVETDTGSKP